MSAVLLAGSAGAADAGRLAASLVDAGVAVRIVQCASAEATTAAGQSPCLILWWNDSDPAADRAAMAAAATVAAGRGALVSVRSRSGLPPPQFAGGFDLSRWRGSRRNRDFTRLVAAVEARLAPASAPPAASRPKWGLLAGTLSFLTGLMALIANFGGVQQPICTIGAAQPAVSDLCGALGWADRPTRAERLAWRKVDRRSCEALRSFAQRFPEGVYRSAAGDLLTARRSSWRTDWSPVSQPLALFVGRDAPPARSEAEARRRAVAEGRDKGERRCRDFAASGVHRYRGVGIEPQEWLCSRLGDGHVCGFDGRAVCRLEARSETLVEQCGALADPPKAVRSVPAQEAPSPSTGS